MKIERIHHVAYRCKDARQTVEWYRDHLGMDFVLAIPEDHVPSTHEPDPYMHLFLDAGGGNILAFFEIPNSPPMGRDPNTPEWVQHIAFKVDTPIGLVASGTGSAAAVRALAREQEMIDAFVCRGGRPGLAGISPLRQLACPTLMIVGGRDEHLPNVRQAFDLIGAHKAWQTVPGTDEFFREPGTLDAAATLATAWFRSHLRPRPTHEGAA